MTTRASWRISTSAATGYEIGKTISNGAKRNFGAARRVRGRPTSLPRARPLAGSGTGRQSSSRKFCWRKALGLVGLPLTLLAASKFLFAPFEIVFPISQPVGALVEFRQEARVVIRRGHSD